MEREERDRVPILDPIERAYAARQVKVRLHQRRFRWLVIPGEPDFLQALEKPDLAHPGTVAHLRLKLEDLKETPVRVTLGAWPNEKSMRRTLRYDGVVAQVEGAEGIAAIAAYVARERPASSTDARRVPFEIVAQGSTPPDPEAAAAIVRPFAEAGATWWIDADWEAMNADAVRTRIRAGPPKEPKSSD